MSVIGTNKSLFLVDGQADIETGYTLGANKITPYE